jgi:hypothetical protein
MWAAAGAQTSSKKKAGEKELTTAAARLAFIQQAQVWTATAVAEMDLRAGPQGAGAFEPDEAVACRYVEKKLDGTTRKFECAVSENNVVKVRYGDENGKVQGAVIASRCCGRSALAPGSIPFVSPAPAARPSWKQGDWTPDAAVQPRDRAQARRPRDGAW